MVQWNEYCETCRIEGTTPLTYAQWNVARFISRARSIGEKNETVVAAILASRQIEQQSYKACIGQILHYTQPLVSKTYGPF
jgi:hypothetical protein